MTKRLFIKLVLIVIAYFLFLHAVSVYANLRCENAYLKARYNHKGQN